MKVIGGLAYSFKWQQLIRTIIQEAGENPHTMFYLIVKDPMIVEEAFLQHTDFLFNIEILTLEKLLHLLQDQKHNKIQPLQKMLLTKCMLEQHKEYLVYQPETIFQTVQQLLPIFDSFYKNDLQQLSLHTLDPLSNRKIKECFTLYKQFMDTITKEDMLYDLYEKATITIKDAQFYIMEDCILQPKQKALIKQLDTQNTIHIIANYNNKDTRLLQKVYRQSFNGLDYTEYETHQPYVVDLIDNLFQNRSASSHLHPFYRFIAPNPKEEVYRICEAIYQNIRDDNMNYRDFIIYYPDDTYERLLREITAQFKMPTTIQEESDYPGMKACLFLLQYIRTQDDADLLLLLDTLLLHKCNHFKMVNTYKKEYRAYGMVTDASFHVIKKHLQEHYITEILTANTIASYSSILLTFLQTEVTYTDSIPTVLSYFSSLTNEEAILLDDYITLLQETKPVAIDDKPTLLDHVYVAKYGQPAYSLLQHKQVYLLGLNEGTVPMQVKDTSILLEQEKQVLHIETMEDILSIQQNHFLKILTTPAKKIVLSYSLVDTLNQTLLPSSYVLQLEQRYDIKPLLPAAIALHHRYQEKQRVGHKTTLNMLLDTYIGTKNQPQSMVPVIFQKVSASQLETYNSCSFKYYCQYLLQLPSMQDSLSLQPNQLGSIVHYILQQCTPHISSFENKDIIKQEIQNALEEGVQKYTHIERKMFLRKNQFIFSCIAEDMYNTILILSQQLQASTFTIDKTEAAFKGDYYGLPLIGIVDRIDTFREYIKIIDYKSSQKEIDLALAMQGFNIQMLLYIDALTKQDQIPAAALYFNTKKRIIRSDTSILEPPSADTFLEQYQMQGYAVDEIIEHIDTTIEKKSKIIKANYVKKDDCYKGNVLTKEELEQVLQKIREHVQTIYQQMQEGILSINPKGSHDKSLHTKVNPCGYCAYKTICHYDVFYNNPTYISKEIADGNHT